MWLDKHARYLATVYRNVWVRTSNMPECSFHFPQGQKFLHSQRESEITFGIGDSFPWGKASGVVELPSQVEV